MKKNIIIMAWRTYTLHACKQHITQETPNNRNIKKKIKEERDVERVAEYDTYYIMGYNNKYSKKPYKIVRDTLSLKNYI